MRIFKKLFPQLEANHVRYLVAGGVAVNLYGIERSTADIEYIVQRQKSYHRRVCIEGYEKADWCVHLQIDGKIAS